MSQPNSQDAFGLHILTSQHKDIRRLRKAQGVAQLHGNKLWKSSFVLMDYLQEFPIASGSRILELGCGWGLSGIFCAKHFDAEVVALDADEGVFPFLELHAEINKVQLNTYCDRFENITEEDLSGFDVIIGADICFWDELQQPIEQLIKRAIAADVSRILLSDPGRPPFRAMAEKMAALVPDSTYTDWDVPEPHNVWGLILDL